MTTVEIEIIKKNGTVEDWNPEKIKKAVNKSATRALVTLTEDDYNKIIKHVLRKLSTLNKTRFTIEEIHVAVEYALDQVNKDVAKSYRDFRNYKKEISSLMDEMMQAENQIRYIGDKSNANKDAKLVATKRSLIYGEWSTKMFEKFHLTDEERQAAKAGYIYIHDKDSRADTINCSLFDLGTVFKGGFEMGNMWYNEPNSLNTAFHVMGDVILATAAQQYGGFTIPEVDKVLERYAEKSYESYKAEYKKISRKANPEIHENELEKEAHEYAMEKTKRECVQGMQGIEYKLNSVGSSRGDYPFTTFSLGLTTTPLGKMISKTLLEVRKEGQGKKGYKRPVLFPKLVFLYDEDLHGKGKSCEDVFDTAIECSSKTMYPDYLSLTGEGYVPSIYKKYKKAISPMGCVDGEEVITYMFEDKLYVESFRRMWNRITSKYADEPQISTNPINRVVRLENKDCYIIDSERGFVEVKYLIRNVENTWCHVTLSNGRSITVTTNHPFETDKGVVYAADLTTDHKILITKKQVANQTIRAKDNESYKAARLEGFTLFSYGKDNHISNKVFSYCDPLKYAYLGGIVDAAGIVNDMGRVVITSRHKEFALQLMVLVQALNGMSVNYKEIKYNVNNKEPEGNVKYEIEFTPNDLLLDELVNTNLRYACIKNKKDFEPEPPRMMAQVVSVEKIVNYDYSYDVTTTSEHFEVSGIHSHNCRAFLSPWYERGGMYPADENDEPVFTGRFNLGVVTLHLPMILAKARHDGTKFYDELDYYLEMIRKFHIRTIEYLGKLKASCNPVAFCEGGFYGGHLGANDPIAPILKPCTISFGVTALNELQMLYNGKSIREDGQFALDVMDYINNRLEEFKKADGILYAIYGTPAESLCFDGNTEVQTYEGIKKIKDITTDDLVYSFNEDNHKVELKKVLNSRKTRENADVVKVTFDNGQEVICTPDHPFAVKNEKSIEYVMAQNLKNGESIKSNYLHIEGNTEPAKDHKVVSVEYLPDNRDVYDIEVEDNHNFFVGGNDGILVHNCGKQIQQFRAEYGIIEGVSSKEYTTNSFHDPVWEDITPIEKQNDEKRFWDKFNGGKIQYCKYPVMYNKTAIKNLVRRAMKMGFYEGVNLSLSYCNHCGHEGLDMKVCPECGSKNITAINRMNGYLGFTRVGTIDGDFDFDSSDASTGRFCSAKVAEIKDRVSM